MERVSRRNFMSGVAAGAGAYGLAGSTNAIPQPAEHDRPHDDEVGEYYGGKVPRVFLNESHNAIAAPHSGVFLYGLICADLSNDDDAPEALLPSSSEGSAGNSHKARLYTSAIPSDGSGTPIGKDGVRRWDLDGYWVAFKPIGKDGELAVSGKGAKKLGRRARHPWVDFSGVRDLEDHAGNLIGATKRRDKAHVNCRVTLHGHRVEPQLPYSPLGRWGEWEAERRDGRKVISATTDSLLAVREWPAGTLKVRVEFKDRAGKVVTHVDFPLTSNRVVFVVTHAVPVRADHPPTLDDTKYFANLVEGLSPDDYKVPTLARGCYGEQPGSDVFDKMVDLLSSRDGHCEISYDG